MNKILSLLSLVTLLLVACENTDPSNEGNNPTPEQPTSVITLTSDAVLNFDHKKNAALISYTIENVNTELEVVATADVDWLYNFTNKSMGSIVFAIDSNPKMEAREGNITVTYGESFFTVKVMQAGSPTPSEVEVIAPMATGHYYGTATQGYYNYYIALTDKGMSSYEPEKGVSYFSVPDAYYYMIDVYTNVKPADDKFMLPAGTYRVQSGGAMHSVNSDTSWYQKNDDKGFTAVQAKFEDGNLVVEDGKMTLTVQFANNEQLETHTVTYEGDYSLVDMTSIYPQY